MELTRVAKFNLNISTETEVLSYTYGGIDPLEVIARVDLGDNAQPIVGNGTYLLHFYINTVVIAPENSIAVPPGATKTIIVSRSVPIRTGDVISITTVGLPGDVNVNTVASLRDVTPITVEQVTGYGAISVDENYGGADNLAYKTIGGVGIANATILVYLTSDYNAGNRDNAFVVGRTTTIVGGAWALALNLDPANYTLIYYKTGAYGPDRKDITVS